MIWMNHKQLEAIGHASLMENGKFQYEIFYSKEYKKGYSLTTHYSYWQEQVFDRKEYFYNFQQSTELNNQFD